MTAQVEGDDFRTKLLNTDGKFGFPIVVVDGRLFTAGLAEDGALQIEEVDSYPLAVTNEDTGVQFAFTWIVSKPALQPFAVNASPLSSTEGFDLP